ncbi:MAG: helix-turn-helix transcriptional regulator [Lentisphaeria bacterium]|nr:helix-turn-helix transcriptional regulator [Lentisphaeria bacterium]
MQTNEQKKVMAALLDYAEKNHKSFANLAKTMGITQNTISNWKKGASISARNQEKIMKLINSDMHSEGCCTQGCSCRNTDHPVLSALLGLLHDLSERDIARLYAFALELKEAPLQYRYSSSPVTKAAEEHAPFNNR